MKPITGRAERLLPALVLTTLVLAISSPAAAGVWDENYAKGQKAFERGDWDNAINYFNIAVKDKPNSAAQYPLANMSVIDYFPYYYLGQAYLYSGNYRLAKGNFHKELSFEAIKGSPHKRHLEKLLEITDLLINPPPPPSDPELENDLKQLQNLLATSNYREAEILFSQIKHRGVEDNRIPIYETWLKQRPEPANLTVVKSGIEPANPAQQLFEQGLGYYLRDQYEPALRSFQSAAASDPKFTLAKSWISKTQSEIQRLSSERKSSTESIVITKTDTATTAPIIFATVPNKTSRQNLIIEGEVRDDKGVDFIQVVLNGATLKNADGQDVIIRPRANDDPKKFFFTLTLPLQMGENQLTLIAYDIDSSDPGFERKAILRVKPFYQTTQFAAILASLILLGIGAVVISKRVKYRLAIVNKYNPYIAGSPIRNEEMFFGREKLIKRVLNTIHNNSLLLYGPRRIGKTSLQHQLQRRLQNLNDPEFHFVPVLIDLQGTSEERFFVTLMEDILETCKVDLDGAASFQLHQNGREYSSRDFSKDLKTVLQILSAKTPKKLKLVLLIDEVDELNKYSEQVNQKLRSVFMKTFAENLVAVMSGISIKKHWQSEGSPWYNFFEEIEVPPFDREDALNLIRRPVAGIFSYDDRAVEKIIEYSECKPFIIQKFCVNVIQRIIELKRRWVTVEDVEAVRAQVLREEAVEGLVVNDLAA